MSVDRHRLYLRPEQHDTVPPGTHRHLVCGPVAVTAVDNYAERDGCGLLIVVSHHPLQSEDCRVFPQFNGIAYTRVQTRMAVLYPSCSGQLVPMLFHPCGNFSDTSSLKFLKTKGSIGHAFTVCIHTENQNQRSFYPFVLHEISVLIELLLGHLCYRLTDVPPQPNSPN